VTHQRPTRLNAFAYTGLHRYHVRIGTWDREPHFSVATTVTLAIDHLLHIADSHQFAVHAYCFMPDHVHVLTCGTCADSHLPPFVGHWKQVVGFEFSSRVQGRRLWQPGYFERVLRDDEPDEIVARYIVANPIRGGLVKSIGEYPHVWSRWPID
jgi:putative transposase